jgi:DNA-binding transcriptional LysR family regulator
VRRDETLEEFLKNSAREGVFKITLGQLRLLYFLRREKALAGVARLLGKDQSSIKKSLDALDEHLSGMVESRLYVSQSARRNNPLTAAGEAAESLASDVLTALQRFAARHTYDGQFVIQMGLTTFLLSFVKPLLLRLRGERDMMVQLSHLRTGNLQDAVLSHEVQCAFGGTVVKRGEAAQFRDGIEAREIERDIFGFMTNYDPGRRLLTLTDIIEQRIPLVLPRSGVVFDFVAAELAARTGREIVTPNDMARELDVVEWCADVHFAFEYMRLGMRQAGMFVLKGIFPHYESFFDPEGGDRFKPVFIELPECQYQSVTVFLTHRDEVVSLDPGHPFRRFLDLTYKWIESRREDTLAQSAQARA